jgi:hypothetical protein
MSNNALECSARWAYRLRNHINGLRIIKRNNYFVTSWRQKMYSCVHTKHNLHCTKYVFMELRGVTIFYSTINNIHLLSQIIYSCETLYIFRTVFPSIIRSSKLRVQQRYRSNSCCYLLLSGMRWNCSSMSPPDSSR